VSTLVCCSMTSDTHVPYADTVGTVAVLEEVDSQKHYECQFRKAVDLRAREAFCGVHRTTTAAGVVQTQAVHCSKDHRVVADP